MCEVASWEWMARGSLRIEDEDYRDRRVPKDTIVSLEVGVEVGVEVVAEVAVLVQIATGTVIGTHIIATEIEITTKALIGAVNA